MIDGIYFRYEFTRAEVLAVSEAMRSIVNTSVFCCLECGGIVLRVSSDSGMSPRALHDWRAAADVLRRLAHQGKVIDGSEP
jgi:hypothetical protein